MLCLLRDLVESCSGSRVDAPLALKLPAPGAFDAPMSRRAAMVGLSTGLAALSPTAAEANTKKMDANEVRVSSTTIAANVLIVIATHVNGLHTEHMHCCNHVRNLLADCADVIRGRGACIMLKS